MGFCLVLLWNAKKISYKKEESLIDRDEYLLILRKKNAKNAKKRNAGKKKDKQKDYRKNCPLNLKPRNKTVSGSFSQH